MVIPNYLVVAYYFLVIIRYSSATFCIVYREQYRLPLYGLKLNICVPALLFFFIYFKKVLIMIQILCFIIRYMYSNSRNVIHIHIFTIFRIHIQNYYARVNSLKSTGDQNAWYFNCTPEALSLTAICIQRLRCLRNTREKPLCSHIVYDGRKYKILVIFS